MFFVVTALSLLLCMPMIMVSGIQYFNCPNPVEPLVMKGRHFFDSVTGEYFPIKGIAYYPRPNAGDLIYSNSVDFFTDHYRFLWQPDIENFVRLGVNVVRIYAVDPSQSHDGFMCALQAAGIYVMVGLLADCEECAIGITEPPSCYPERLKNRGQWIINVFSKYTNTLAFSAGNEVTIFAANIADNAPCQKKFMRDMRAYIQKCRKLPASILPRDIPVGMVNWDGERMAQTLYFNCRTNTSDIYEEAEWYGLNVYLHCDANAQSIDDLTGWINLRNDFASFNLPSPVIIAEYGCRSSGFPTIGEFAAQREWLQIDALYSSLYTDVFAGGVVFEYSAEKWQADGSRQQTPWPYYNYAEYQFGVGYYSPIGCNHNDTLCEYVPYPEFDLLAQKFVTIDVSFVDALEDYVPKGELPQCPNVYAPITDFVWPSDTSPDELCYEVGTTTPTGGPSLNTTTNAPVISPPETPTGGPSLYNTTNAPAVSPPESPTTSTPSKTTIPQAPSPVFLPTPLPVITSSSPNGTLEGLMLLLFLMNLH